MIPEDILIQLQSDPQLQAAIAIFALLLASLVGGIGRMIFMGFMALRLGRMLLLLVAGGGLAAHLL